MKTKGTLLKSESNCTLRVVLGDFNHGNGKYVKHYIMFSPKTGIHQIDSFYNQPDKRVLTHWDGFLANQK